VRSIREMQGTNKMEAHKTTKGRGFLPALRWRKAF
jgi:hypothetical protein